MGFIEFMLTAFEDDMLASSRERDKREAEKQEEIDKLERELRSLKSEIKNLREES
jgi:cell division protein FtsB